MNSAFRPAIVFFGFCIVAFLGQEFLDSYVQIMMIYVLLNMILALSLNLVNGITGQFSLGQAGFMAVGAYISAYGLKNFQILPGMANFFFWATMGGLGAALAGLIVGLPSLRLRGDYLAVVTLGFGEIIRVVALNLEVVGGARGYSDIPKPQEIVFESFFAGKTVAPFVLQFIHAGFWFCVCFFVLWRWVNSGYGRGLLAIREDELAAEASGVPTTASKVSAFVVSSFFAGTAGACLASQVSFINPSTFGFSRSVDAVMMVVLGGMGSFTGAILAAVFVTLLPELLRPLQDLTGVDLRMVIYSLILIFVMILRPQGLMGRLEIADIWRRYVRRTS